jgi:2,3-bisphosphoglycerate-independent phosphoglycerate mutase
MGARADNAVEAIKAGYEKDVTDEFVEPTAIGDYAGMNDGDGLLMANFRADRAREILTSLVDPAFDGFQRKRQVSFAARVGMVNYSDHLKPFLDALFQPIELTDILCEVISKAGLKQLHTAETEKYAHVTFFFNGGREEPFPGEERVMVQSPNVPTYDLQPEMSAFEVTDKLVTAIESNAFDFIVVNFANGDMVGHTGIMEAAVKAVEAVDVCLGRLDKAVVKAGGVMLVTADHGNCEKMRDGAQPHTAHTLYPVPALLVNAPAWVKGLHDGGLADLAPTVLQLLGLDVPVSMSGHSLIDETGIDGEHGGHTAAVAE